MSDLEPSQATSNLPTTKNVELSELLAPRRQKLPPTRNSITHKFNISGHEGYITVGLFEDNRPGEVFLKMAKEGSTVSGLMDTIGIPTSLALQFGVPVDALAAKFEHSRFEPLGWTSNPAIGDASSLVDYIFRWLRMEFGTETDSVAKNPIRAN
jgi:ribonucleoside-diphosphate reductase alpha chain